ncbi:hypothetical protein TorRG33x02_293970 [Trema orientale]|uniref:Uncharacterized protein n=1 Tax=Trema orientale TaxID=63057 RepID=A0A2P5C8C2_TREOI|nr:hypothetical protein TorRG33x02_293970 [Trema orientale]
MEGSRGWLGQKVGKLQSLFPNHRPGPLGRERERSFIENGSKLLEELITSCKDKRRCYPIRNFSAEQVIEATNITSNHIASMIIILSGTRELWTIAQF